MTLEAEALFGWPTTTTRVGISNAVADDPAILTASASGDMVTLTAMSDGETEVEITATVAEESSTFMPSQTVSNVASIKFKVVVDAPMIVTRSNEQALATAAVAKAAAASPNNIWEPERGVTAMILLAATATEDGLFDVPASITPRYLAESSNENVMASVSGMNVELTPMVAGMAMVTVTAVDTDRPGNAVSVDFNVTVTAQAAIRALSQGEVNAVFEGQGAADLVARGSSIDVDMSKLFEVGEGVTPSYSAESSDADVLMASASGMMLTLTPGQAPAGGQSTITVTALDRAGGGAPATVMYMATVDMLPPVLTITSVPMDMVEEKGSITVTAMLNQKAPANMTIALAVSGPAAPAEAEIMLMAGMESASTMLMADDDYDPMSDWSDIVIVASHEAIMGGSAVLTLSVTENDSVITYTLDPPAGHDMQLVEGDMDHANGTMASAMLTVTASEAVPMDTEVTIMRDRSMSDADEMDYALDPEMITITAGEMTGTTMLTATEDNMDDSGHASPEALTLFAMVGNTQTNSVSFNIWDYAVPALPLIAQLLLAAFLAIGGYRRYLRR